MLKKKFYLILLTILLLLPISLAQENVSDKTEIILFYSKDCPHCHDEIVFLNKLINKYPVELKLYEIRYNKENLNYFIKFAKEHNVEANSVPLTFINGEIIIGFRDESTTGKKIEDIILKQNQKQDIVKWFGKEINLQRLSLPALTLILGIMDGFNPCAMWVLAFMLALLISSGSRKKLWLIGGTFIIVSGIVYYLFMAAWLNAFLFIGYIRITQIIIGILSIVAGVYYLREFYKQRKSAVCEVTTTKQKEKIIDRINKIVSPKAILPATIIGVIILAFTVNMVELLCSVGLPAIYTRILTLNNLSTLSYYAYMLFYILLYMLDDIIIFLIAAITLSHVGFTGRYSKYMYLIGGLLILFLGFSMLFKPELLIMGI